MSPRRLSPVLRRRLAAVVPSAPRWRMPEGERRTAVLWLMAGALAFAVLGVLAVSRASTASVPGGTAFEHVGRFGYGADVEPGPVYRDERVKPGDPIFLKVVDTVGFRFDYGLRSERPQSVAGKVRLVGVLSDGQGWRRTLMLQNRQAFVGARASVRGRIRPARLRELIDAFERATGTHIDAYRFTLVPQVEVEGSVGARLVRQTFAPPLRFRLDTVRMQLDPHDEELSALTRSQAVVGTRQVPASVSLGVVTLRVSTARIVAVVGALGSALGILALGIARAPAARRDEPDEIERRYGDVIVPVAARRRPSAATAIQIAEVESLVRLADRYDRMILHEHEAGVHTYLVEEGGAQYFYETGRPVRPRRRGTGAEPRLDTRPLEPEELERQRFARLQAPTVRRAAR